MHSRFILGVILSLGLFALAFEAIGAESPGPGAEGQSIGDRRSTSRSNEVIVRLPDGQNVRAAGELAALIQKGYSALQSKQYDRSISLLTAALQTNPDKNIALFIHFYRASAYSDKGQPDRALSDWTAAIQLNSKYAPAWYNRGRDYGVVGDTDKAISDYTEAIRLNPTYLVAYVNRANQYSEKRQYTLAFRDATTAIQLDPKHANAYHNRGAFHADIGEFEKAIADYSKAIQFDPRSATTFYARGSAYEDLEKFDKAIADYDRVIRIGPKDSDDYAVRARAYFTKGNYKEAVSSYEKAIQLSPNNDNALRGLAWLRATCPEASLRNGKEAIRMSIKACELSKWKEPGPFFTLAAAYAEAGDFDKAVKYQVQAIQRKSAYTPVGKGSRERLALYRDHKAYRSKPLVAH
jgi:tetratricopeptide (TPR) repeat protein